MAETEWRVIEIDANGDISTIDSYPTKAAAVRVAKQHTPKPGCLITVEGQRDYDDGTRRFRRTGFVVGPADHPERSCWERVDDIWYRAGEEPGFVEDLHL